MRKNEQSSEETVGRRNGRPAVFLSRPARPGAELTDEDPHGSAYPGGPLRPFMITITVLLIVAALYMAKVVVVPVVLAALLTFLLTPVVSWMQRYRVPRVAAAIVTSLVVFSFMGGILFLVLVQLQGMAKDLTEPKNYKRIHAKAAALHQLLSGDEFQQLTSLLDETIQTISPPAPTRDTVDVAVVGARTAGLLASPLGQGPLLAAFSLASGTAGTVGPVAAHRPPLRRPRRPISGGR